MTADMTKHILQTSGNTIFSVGSIYTLIRDELNILLSLIIAVLTIVYIIFQTRKCIEDTKYKKLENHRLLEQERRRGELHSPANKRHKHTPKTPIEDEQD